MKPSELFPGAVTAQGVVADALCDSVVFTDGRTELYDSVSPLPLSPAVLRGLGVEYEHGLGHWNYNDEFHVKIDNNPWYYIDPYMKVVESTHQLQALSLHLHGVELVWSQSEYEKAPKEEAK